MYNFINIY